jgi:hypothetical protein
MSNLRNNKNLILLVGLISLFILGVSFGIFYIFYSESSNNTQTTTYSNASVNSNDKSINNTKIFKDDNENISSSSEENNSPTNRDTLSDSSNDFIFPNSSVEVLKDYQLSGLSKEKLAYARNEIFARHGYIFKTEPFKSYFPKKSWYKPNPSFTGNYAELNEIERYNVDLIKKYESR